MQQLVDRSLFPRRFIVLLLTMFAGFGLLLAALGIYAVISYSVSRRKHEIGIRIALGASPGDLQGQVLRDTARLTIVGLVVGLPASLAVARSMRSLLFEVTFVDSYTIAGVLAVLCFAAAAAGYLPARRASRMNAVDALRAE
jgi:ABC-type antimicrobial peptide transport system permease subunit